MQSPYASRCPYAHLVPLRQSVPLRTPGAPTPHKTVSVPQMVSVTRKVSVPQMVSVPLLVSVPRLMSVPVKASVTALKIMPPFLLPHPEAFTMEANSSSMDGKKKCHSTNCQELHFRRNTKKNHFNDAAIVDSRVVSGAGGRFGTNAFSGNNKCQK